VVKIAQPKAKAVITKEPVYVDPSMIWKPGMGVTKKPGITIPVSKAEIKPLIVDIEATGAFPWNSRLICIGYKDPMRPEEDPIVIFSNNEEEMLKQFFTVFTNGGYNQFIAYNASFDFRYIFAKALYYRISCGEFVNADIYDIMQILKQVKEEYVFGMNKAGSLEEWAMFLLGMKKPLTYEQMMELYNNKEYEQIIEYNKNDVQMEFYLYALIELVKGQPYTGESFAVPATTISSSGSLPQIGSGEGTAPQTTWNARCPVCYSSYEVPISQTEYVCPIDKTVIKRGE